ncbi:MAG: hypothetical protein ACSHWW_06025 [Nonlabens sp.]|uniref:hypothetical protein n=1 Tax=Nonlabens sp. TaxID=1888209 RepID=UPI003EF867B6
MKDSNQSIWWKLKNDKSFFFLLPSYFKLAGIALAVISILTVVLLNNLDHKFQRIELLNEILYSLVLVGLTFISFSKDKDEDERITNLRFRSFSFAFGLMVLLFVFQPLIELLSDFAFTDLNHEEGYYSGFSNHIFIALVIIAQLMYFYKFKKEL